MSDKSDHDLLIEVHSAVVGAKLPERVGKLEVALGKTGVWITIISSAVVAAVLKVFTGNGK